MILNRKFLLWGFLCLLAVLGTGCSGINSTHSVSPASFLLPGFIKNEPRPEAPDNSVPQGLEPTNQLARL